MKIQCEKCIIRLFRPQDKFSLQKHLNNKKICSALHRVKYPYTLKEAEKYITESIKEYQKEKHPYTFAIDIRGFVVGGISLNEIKGKKAEFGYWLAEKYWNKGIMTDVIRKFTDYCFKNMKLNYLYAEVFSWNKSSIKTLEKSGYKKDKKLSEERNQYFFMTNPSLVEPS